MPIPKLGYSLNCAPQLLRDGRYAGRLVVTEHHDDEAIDRAFDLGDRVYESAEDAAQAAARAAFHWIDRNAGPAEVHNGYAYEVSATSHSDDGWTGEARIYGSSSDRRVFDRRTGYIRVPGKFRDDGEAREAARKHAIGLIESGTGFAWEDE